MCLCYMQVIWYYPGSGGETPFNKFYVIILECLTNHFRKENIGKYLIRQAEGWGAADFNEVLAEAGMVAICNHILVMHEI